MSDFGLFFLKLNFPHQQGSHCQISTFCIFESSQPILAFFQHSSNHFLAPIIFWNLYIYIYIYYFFVFAHFYMNLKMGNNKETVEKNSQTEICL